MKKKCFIIVILISLVVVSGLNAWNPPPPVQPKWRYQTHPGGNYPIFGDSCEWVCKRTSPGGPCTWTLDPNKTPSIYIDGVQLTCAPDGWRNAKAVYVDYYRYEIRRSNPKQIKYVPYSYPPVPPPHPWTGPKQRTIPDADEYIMKGDAWVGSNVNDKHYTLARTPDHKVFYFKSCKSTTSYSEWLPFEYAYEKQHLWNHVNNMPEICSPPPNVTSSMGVLGGYSDTGWYNKSGGCDPLNPNCDPYSTPMNCAPWGVTKRNSYRDPVQNKPNCHVMQKIEISAGYCSAKCVWECEKYDGYESVYDSFGNVTGCSVIRECPENFETVYFPHDPNAIKKCVYCPEGYEKIYDESGELKACFLPLECPEGWDDVLDDQGNVVSCIEPECEPGYFKNSSGVCTPVEYPTAQEIADALEAISNYRGPSVQDIADSLRANIYKAEDFKPDHNNNIQDGFYIAPDMPYEEYSEYIEFNVDKEIQLPGFQDSEKEIQQENFDFKMDLQISSGSCEFDFIAMQKSIKINFCLYEFYFRLAGNLMYLALQILCLISLLRVGTHKED